MVKAYENKKIYQPVLKTYWNERVYFVLRFAELVIKNLHKI